jgi:hypothetical protein
VTHQCQYCQRSFVREKSLAVHVCEAKRRRLSQNEPGVRLGFQAYLKFYEITQGPARNKTFDDFADSAYYRAFVKFGQYCVDIRAVNPARFTEWVVRQNKKLDYWCSDSLYTEYLQQHLRTEAVSDALARAIEFSIAWSSTAQSPSHDCLRFGNTNALVYAITAGRISAWVIYNCDSGQQFLSNLTADQVAMVWPYVDADFWQRKFRDYPEDQQWARTVLAQAGW